jgi:hypothetical protein|tara:strand:- start:223 stop:405 length:183 start_codon:yes stop_codon:yes gene_type:complete
MIEPNKLKIGDIVYINKAGQQSKKGVKVTITNRKECDKYFYRMVGISDDGRKWYSCFIWK